MRISALQTAALLCMALVACVPPAFYVEAQTFTTVASPVIVDGQIRDGDIVSYDAEQNLYHPSKQYADEKMYGVVVLDPVLNVTSDNDDGVSDPGVPVVRYGEAVVNVSTFGGSIRAGDLVTTSNIEGIGQRVSRDEGSYVLGFALADMEPTGETVLIEDTLVELGRVPIALRIGPYVTKEGAERIASSTLVGQGVAYDEKRGTDGIDGFKVFRYLLAALVSMLAILVAARRFGDTFSQSVISVGRNPLARSQIRSMVIWNSFLIILISSVGFGISALILFLP